MSQSEDNTFNKTAIAAAASTLTLVVLRLDGQLDWSWRWTLSPLWVPLAFSFAHAFFRGILAGLNKTEYNKRNENNNDYTNS